MSEKCKNFVEGRYPHKPVALEPKNMVVETQVYKDEVVVRVDDMKHLDFWMQIVLPKEQLKEMLKEMEEME